MLPDFSFEYASVAQFQKAQAEGSLMLIQFDLLIEGAD
jgi:hypothetical protein